MSTQAMNTKNAQVGEVWKNIQAQYGEKPKAQREIKKTLDKDDFMKIMVTQMKNQDPTKPLDAEKFGAQLAQFTSVEQLHNMGKAMEKLTTANQPLERLTMTNLIGKSVTIDKDRFMHTKNQNSVLSFDLPERASEVSLKVLSETGDVVFEKDLGSHMQGKQTFMWDGKNKSGIVQNSGQYMARITAKDVSGSELPIASTTLSQVTGVSFSGKEPVLIVRNGSQEQKIKIDQVVQVHQDDGKMSQVQQVSPVMGNGIQNQISENQSPAEQPAKNQMAALNGIKIDPEFFAKQAQEKPSSPGFPNGLQESEE